MADNFTDFALEKAEKPGFFENILKQAGQSARRTLATTRLSDDVLKEGIDDNTASILAQEAEASKSDYISPERNELEHSFADEAKDWNEAKGFLESAGAIGEFALEGAKQIVTNPKGVIYETAAQAGNMIPITAAAVGGAFAGGAAGTALFPGLGTAAGAIGGGIVSALSTFMAEWHIESGAKLQEVVMEGLQKRGLEPTEQNIQALLNDPQFTKTAIQRSRDKATGTAGSDAILNALTAGTARGITTMGKGLLKTASKVGLGAAEVVQEGVTEGLGELLADGKIDPEEVAMEMMAGGASAYTKTAGFLKAGAMKANKRANDEVRAEAETKVDENITKGTLETSIDPEANPSPEEVKVVHEVEKLQIEHTEQTVDAIETIDEEKEDRDALPEVVHEVAEATGHDTKAIHEEATLVNDKDLPSFTKRMVQAFGNGIKKYILKLWNYVKSIKGLGVETVNEKMIAERFQQQINRNLQNPNWADSQIAKRQKQIDKLISLGHPDSPAIKLAQYQIQQIQNSFNPQANEQYDEYGPIPEEVDQQYVEDHASQVDQEQDEGNVLRSALYSIDTTGSSNQEIMDMLDATEQDLRSKPQMEEGSAAAEQYEKDIAQSLKDIQRHKNEIASREEQAQPKKPSNKTTEKPSAKVVVKSGLINKKGSPYQKDGVNTLRKAGTIEHFGNPFNERGFGTVKTNSIPESVERFRNWLLGKSDQDVEPERRKWYVDQITSGKLDGKDLLYYTDLGQTSHADALLEIVQNRKKYFPEALQSEKPVSKKKEPSKEDYAIAKEFDKYVERGYYSQWRKDYVAKHGEKAAKEADNAIRRVRVFEQFGKEVAFDEEGTLDINIDDIPHNRSLDDYVVRVMVGNHGVYIEFSQDVLKYLTFVKKRLQYNEYKSNQGDKFYDQFKTVNYADYEPGYVYAALSDFTKSIKQKENNKVQPEFKDLKIISGAQSGADIAGLQVAKELGLKTGGTAAYKHSRFTDDGKKENRPDISEKYGLTEGEGTERTGKYGKYTDAYHKRTIENAQNADGTVWFGNPKSPGGRLTLGKIAQEGKPNPLVNPTAEELSQWLIDNDIKVLNVAGNREHTNNGITNTTKNILEAALTGTKQKEETGRETIPEGAEIRGEDDVPFHTDEDEYVREEIPEGAEIKDEKKHREVTRKSGKKAKIIGKKPMPMADSTEDIDSETGLPVEDKEEVKDLDYYRKLAAKTATRSPKDTDKSYALKVDTLAKALMKREKAPHVPLLQDTKELDKKTEEAKARQENKSIQHYDENIRQFLIHVWNKAKRPDFTYAKAKADIISAWAKAEISGGWKSGKVTKLNLSKKEKAILINNMLESMKNKETVEEMNAKNEFLYSKTITEDERTARNRENYEKLQREDNENGGKESIQKEFNQKSEESDENVQDLLDEGSSKHIDSSKINRERKSIDESEGNRFANLLIESNKPQNEQESERDHEAALMKALDEMGESKTLMIGEDNDDETSLRQIIFEQLEAYGDMGLNIRKIINQLKKEENIPSLKYLDSYPPMFDDLDSVLGQLKSEQLEMSEDITTGLEHLDRMFKEEAEIAAAKRFKYGLGKIGPAAISSSVKGTEQEGSVAASIYEQKDEEGIEGFAKEEKTIPENINVEQKKRESKNEKYKKKVQGRTAEKLAQEKADKKAREENRSKRTKERIAEQNKIQRDLRKATLREREKQRAKRLFRVVLQHMKINKTAGETVEAFFDVITDLVLERGGIHKAIKLNPKAIAFRLNKKLRQKGIKSDFLTMTSKEQHAVVRTLLRLANTVKNGKTYMPQVSDTDIAIADATATTSELILQKQTKEQKLSKGGKTKFHLKQLVNKLSKADRETYDNTLNDLSEQDRLEVERNLVKILNDEKMAEVLTRVTKGQPYTAEVVDAEKEMTQLGEAIEAVLVDAVYENESSHRFLNTGGSYVYDLILGSGRSDEKGNPVQVTRRKKTYKEKEAIEEALGYTIKRRIENGKSVYDIFYASEKTKDEIGVDALRVQEVQHKRGIEIISKTNFSDNRTVKVMFYDKKGGLISQYGSTEIPFATFSKLRANGTKMKVVSKSKPSRMTAEQISNSSFDHLNENYNYVNENLIKNGKGEVIAAPELHSGYVSKNDVTLTKEEEREYLSLEQEAAQEGLSKKKKNEIYVKMQRILFNANARNATEAIREALKQSPLADPLIIENLANEYKKHGIYLSHSQLIDAYISVGGKQNRFVQEVQKLVQSFYLNQYKRVFLESKGMTTDEIENLLSRNLTELQKESYKKYLDNSDIPLSVGDKTHFEVLKSLRDQLITINSSTITEPSYIDPKQSKEQRAAKRAKEQKIKQLKENIHSFATEKAISNVAVNLEDFFIEDANGVKESLPNYDPLKHSDVRIGGLISSVAHALYKGVAKVMGAKLVVISSDSYVSRYHHDSVTGESTIIVNVNDAKPFIHIFAHEMFHHVVNKASASEYAEFKKSILKLIATDKTSVYDLIKRKESDPNFDTDAAYQRLDKIIEDIKQGDDLAQEELLAEVFAWAASNKKFYETLGKSLKGKSLAAKLVIRMVQQLTKTNELKYTQGAFTYEGELLLGEHQMAAMYDLMSSLVGDSFNRNPATSMEKYFTPVGQKTKEELKSYADHSEKWLKGRWKHIFPKGIKSYKDVMNAIEIMLADVIKLANRVKPIGMMSDWLANKEAVRLAHIVSNVSERAVSRARLKTKHHGKIFTEHVKQEQEKVFAEMHRGEWVVTKTKDGFTYKKGSDGEGLKKNQHQIDPENPKDAKHVKVIMESRSKERVAEKLHDDFVRGGIDVTTKVGVKKAKHLGYSDNVINMMKEMKQISDEIFTRLQKVYPELDRLDTHYGQSIKWYNGNTVIDAALDAVLNPELNINKSKLRDSSDRFTKKKALYKTTREIASEYDLNYKTIDPTEMFLNYVRETERIINLHKMLNEGQDSGHVKVFLTGVQAAKHGYHPITDNATRILRSLNNTVGFSIVDNETGEMHTSNVFSTDVEAQHYADELNKNIPEGEEIKYSITQVDQPTEAAVKTFLVTATGHGEHLNVVARYTSEEQAKKAAERYSKDPKNIRIMIDDKTGEKVEVQNYVYEVEPEVTSGNTTEVARYYFTKDLQKMMNTIVAEDKFRTSTILGVSGETLLNIKNKMVAFQFALSGFHAITIGHEMMASYSAWRQGKGVHNKDKRLGLKERIKDMSPLRIWQDSREIVKLFEFVQENEFTERSEEVQKAAQKRLAELLDIDDVDVIEMLDMYFHSGGLSEQDRTLRSNVHDMGTIRYRKDEDITLENGEVKFNPQAGFDFKEMKASLSEIIKEQQARYPNNPLLQKFNTAQFALLEGSTAWLMEGFIPKVKMAMWAREYSFNVQKNAKEISAGNTTKEEIARQTMKFIEDRFGEVNWKNMWMNPTFKTMLQFVFRSFTWFTGSWKALSKAGIDLTKYGWYKIKGEDIKLTEKGYWGINAVVLHLMAVQVMTALLSAVSFGGGEEPPEEEDRTLLSKMLFISGSGGDIYSLPSYVTEAYKIMDHLGVIGVGAEPEKLIVGHANNLITNTFETFTGKNWRGVRISDEDDWWTTKLVKSLLHIFAVAPISVSTMYQDWRTHGFRPSRIMTSAAGITSAPSSAKRSEAITKAYRLRREEHHGKPISQEAADLKDSVKRAAYQYSEGNKKPLNNMLLKREITHSTYKKALTTIPTIDGEPNPLYIEPILRATKYLSIESAINVWDYMTPREKEVTREMILKKYDNTIKRHTRTSKARQKLLENMRSAGIV